MPVGYGGQDIGGTRSSGALGGYGGGGRVSGRTGGGSGIGGALQRANDWLSRNTPTAVKGAAIGSGLAGLPGGLVGGAVGGLADLLGGRIDLGGLGDPGRAGGQLGPRGDRGRGGSQTIMPLARATGVPPLGTAMQRYTRPDEAQAPGWMRFDNVMSPLQRRSYIATQGISGEQGLYRSKEAKDYYSNLLARTLIGPTGQLGDFNQLLPIEMQYLQALGIPGWKDTAGLLGGLGIKPGMGVTPQRQGLGGTSQAGQMLLNPNGQRMLGSGPNDGTLTGSNLTSLQGLLAGGY
jgi:hypothetical protein